MTSSAAVVELYHCSQLLIQLEFNDKPATPPNTADNITSSNFLCIGPLVDVLKLLGGGGANVLSDNGCPPLPIVTSADLASALWRTVTHNMSKALDRVVSMSPRQLS